MADIITQLPDAVANQIAAGEVVQRPASVVKELMENAIDAGASSVKVVVKDAGKTLIQIIDDGCGMTKGDARLCFARHATSKIKKAEDLFHIHTKGFRGEALASISAIAHVSMKTRLREEKLGWHIEMEGSELKREEACQTSAGTVFSVKNLFYNVPARRNFLKSDKVELNHIIEEFYRVVLTHPQVAFSLYHNEHELFNLSAAVLRQRIVHLMGAKYNQKLVPIDEHTDIVQVNGFVGKPEYAKKTRGEQYLFVNDRFIKSSYLNHAISQAYKSLLSNGYYPSYFLYLKVAPSLIDVNIHPTKTEVKFQDERAIYAIVQSAVRNSLGKFNIAPSLDFDQESSINIGRIDASAPVKNPEVKVNPHYNPFHASQESGQRESSYDRKRVPSSWPAIFGVDAPDTVGRAPQIPEMREIQESLVMEEKQTSGLFSGKMFQLKGRYIVTQIKSGMVVIDQHRAHARVLYERFMEESSVGQVSSQRLLFPEHVDMGQKDFQLFSEMEDEIKSMGFDFETHGSDGIVLSALPAELKMDNPTKLVEEFLEQIKNHTGNLKLSIHEQLALSLAFSGALRYGEHLETEEMQHLVDELFACQQPYHSPTGKPTIVTFTLSELDQKFQ